MADAFKIMADAFNVAVGGVLLKLENEWRPISYIGYKLLKYQLLNSDEKKCFAVIIRVCKYRQYLKGQSL